MKKTISLLAMAAMALIASAQLKVVSIEKLPATEGKGYYHPQFAPQGDYLLLTSNNYRGLSQYDLNTKEAKVLTEAENAGYESQVSEGGKVVVYRDVEYINNRRYTSIKSIEVATGKVTTIDEPSREQYAFRFMNGEIKVAKQEKMLTKRLVSDITRKEVSLVAAIENKNLVLYMGNTRKVINPQGDASYIWPRISPDQKNIAYTCIKGEAYGTYVYNIETGNVTALGYIGAPQWYGNDYVVGMLDLWDDGYKYTRSPLVSICINDVAKRSVLEVPGHDVILYPAASEKAGALAFEADGAIYLMKVSVK